MNNKNFLCGALAILHIVSLALTAHAEQPPQPNVIYLNAGAIDTSAPQTQARAKALAATTTGKQLRLIQFDGPIQPEWVADLEKSGMHIVDYVPENSYLVYGDTPAVQTMQAKASAQSHVRWEGAYRGVDKIHPVAAQSATAQPSKARPDPTLFSIQLVLDPTSNPATLALIDSLKLAPVIRQGAVDKYYNIIVSLPPGSISQISDQPDVISILPYNTPGKRDEKQCIIMAGQLSGNVPTGPGYLAWLANKGFTQAQFDASGLVVDVTDSPIDNGTTNVNHFALYKDGTISNSSPSRVVYNRLEGTANTGSVTQAADGHGNLNAHIIAGQANLTNSPHADTNGYRYGMGVAPFVKLGGSIIFDTSSFTSPVYDDLAARAYRDGARVSGNSWGADTAGAYDADAQNYDYLVRDAQRAGSAVSTAGNQQMTFVFAAGNAGSGTQTVGSPGTAKNVITVGAAENVRAFGGSDGSGIADTGADSANDIISFSSRGPCSDSRKKPDIMAPGTHITGGAPQNVKTMTGTGTALAAFAADGSGVSGGVSSIYFPSSGQQFYTASSGTSHSTPAVAGAAALVYQWFINKGWATASNPASPAMIKAYLMNAARYMTGTSANDTLYSNNQGMGMVNLDTSFDDTPRFLRDQLTADLFTASGQSRTWTGTVSTGAKPLRITLAWTDAPGSTTGNAYKNNLDLTVTVNGTTYKGNVFSSANSTTGGTADVRNNVESVFIPAGTTGNVTITVAGTNINSDGVPNYGTTVDQDFALVAYNFAEQTAASVVAAGSSLVAEGDSPANNAIDPGETVTVGFGLQNVGSLNTTNVTATLLATNGVTPITGPVSYGALLTNGVAVTNNFSFSVAGTLGNNFDAVLALNDGTNNLGNVSYTFRLGPPPPIVLSEDFASLTGGSDTSTGGPLTTEITTNLTTNFPTSVKAYSAGGAVKLGSSSAVGSITSRTLDLSGNGGNFSVKFDVKGWTTVEGQIKVTVGSLPSQTVSYAATVSSSYETKTLNFTGGTAATTVKIETTAKRAFIDNVQVLSAASVATPVIYSPLTATGSVGSAFNYSILASNSPTSYGATGLPAGLTNNAATGVISGTPATAGTNNVTISASNAGGTDSKTLVVTVNPAPSAPVISSALIANAQIDSPFSYQITASGSPTSYGATGLPNGLSVNASTGAITGNPTELGTFSVSISATNVSGTGTATLVLTVASTIPAPTITSASTASGTVGSAFNYAITASGSPTSFAATGLPSGLVLDTSTGAISGTPSAAGTSLVSISASNAGGTGFATLVLTIQPAAAVVTTLFQEDFISITNGNSTNTTGSSTAWAGNTNFPTVVTAYQAGGCVKLGSGSAIGSITSRTLDLSGNSGSFTVAYKVKGWSTVEGNIKVTVGSTSQTNSYTNVMTGTFESKVLNFSGGTSGSTVKIETTAKRAFIDDVVVTTGNSSTSTVNISGSISPLSSSYGSASLPSAPLTITGSNLATNVTVSVSPGFEVSQTTGGGSGYAASQSISPVGGAVSNAVYVRLAASNAVGSYAGSLLCNSTGAAGASVAIPSSTVAKKDVSVAGLVGENKVYDATTAATFTGTPSYDGLANGDSFSVSGSPIATFSNASVGIGKAVTVTGYNAPSGNYNILPTTLTADITPKPVTIAGISAVSKVYDGTTSASLTGTPELSGVEAADSGNVSVGGTPSGAFASANVGVDIGVAVSGYALTGSAGSNYSPTQPAGLAADITARSATVTASDRTKLVGTSLSLGPNQTSGFVASGLASGERVDKVTLTASGGTATNDPVGTYAITPSDAAAVPSIPPNPFRADNYNITYVNGTLSVTSSAALTFDQWMSTNYPQLTGADALAAADPDKDGIANLLEYYMGLSPVAADKGVIGVAWANGSPSSVSMTYRRAKSTTGVAGGVRWSSSMVSTNWSTNGVTESAVDMSTYENVTATVTNAPSDTQKFLRLRVTQP